MMCAIIETGSASFVAGQKRALPLRGWTVNPPSNLVRRPPRRLEVEEEGVDARARLHRGKLGDSIMGSGSRIGSRDGRRVGTAGNAAAACTQSCPPARVTLLTRL